MASPAPPEGGIVTETIPKEPKIPQPALARSRNLLPAYPRRFVEGIDDADFVKASIDIDEPLTMMRGQRKEVTFRYRSGIPQATVFGITWHATEAEADALINQLQDEPVPSFRIVPPYPRRDTGAIQVGTVILQSPLDMREGIIYGAMMIYQP